LPWRNTTKPYEIWLSEVILQQTRVAQGLPYYLDFVNNFPDVNALAKADEQHVLRLWQGLGYYSRARNLHKCAKEIMNNYGGVFPKTYLELQKLPGIGKYTAAAIASFAYKTPVPVVDGNVYRVLARVYGLRDDIATTQGIKKFYELAESLISVNKPDDHNQAIMEFGALQCTPKKPDCLYCPLTDACIARKEGVQMELPVKTKKVKVKTRYFYYVVFSYEGRILMRKRQNEGIWEGLYDFHLIETTEEADMGKLAEMDGTLAQALDDGVLEEESKNYKHILTHQRIYAKFLKISLNTAPSLEKLTKINNYGVYDPDQAKALPKPILVDKYLQESIF